MTPQQQDELARSLCEGLQAERAIYGKLAEISREQGEVLAVGATEEILTLARAKEAELARIEDIEARIGPLKDAWAEHLEEMDEAPRRQVEEEIDAVKAVLRTLIELEHEGQQGANELRQQTSENLKSVDGGRRVQQAYSQAGAGQQQPRFLDKKE